MFSLFQPIYLVYILVLYVFIVSARNNKNIIRSLIGGFIVMNVMNLDVIKDKFVTGFLSIIIFELVNLFISFIVLQLTYNFSNMNRNAILFVIELIISAVLVYIYYLTSVFFLSVI